MDGVSRLLRRVLGGEPVRQNGLTLAESGGRLVNGLFFSEWDHEMVPPFRFQMVHEVPHIGGAMWENWSDIGSALQRFREASLPPRQQNAALIIDGSFQVVFGYSAMSSVMEKVGSPGWYGVRAGFDAAEQTGLFDEMDLAVWEATAERMAR